MKNLSKKFAQLSAKYKPKCDPAPGKWNSCEPCKDCGRRAKYPESEGTPIPCCIITPPLIFEFDNIDRGIVYSNTITINVNCQTRLFFTAYQIAGGANDSVLLITLNSGSDFQLDEGNPVAIDVNSGDTLQFKLIKTQISTCCWECYVYNETCNIQNTICLTNLCTP